MARLKRSLVRFVFSTIRVIKINERVQLGLLLTRLNVSAPHSKRVNRRSVFSLLDLLSTVLHHRIALRQCLRKNVKHALLQVKYPLRMVNDVLLCPPPLSYPSCLPNGQRRVACQRSTIEKPPLSIVKNAEKLSISTVWNAQPNSKISLSPLHIFPALCGLLPLRKCRHNLCGASVDLAVTTII